MASEEKDEKDEKLPRLQWLARLFSHDPQAISDEQANANLFDRMNDFGMENFLQTFRPLNKLREQRGPIRFNVTHVRHAASDLTFTDFTADEEVLFEVRVRFEDVSPHRIRYWSAYPPLPAHIVVRDYDKSDAAGCVELERACPMESDTGDQWIIDRDRLFDDYLQLMAPIDAKVAVDTAKSPPQIVGFFANTLRPIRSHGEDAFCVYQCHYRVHPDYRRGSVSMAMASAVDARRTFDGLPVVFPYSMVDPHNAHMQYVGFPAVPELVVARLSIPVSCGAPSSDYGVVEPAQVCELVNHTHGNRTLFKPYDAASLTDRCNRIAGYSLADLRGNADAVLGIWQANERNVLRGSVDSELHLSFVIDYGYTSIDALLRHIRSACDELGRHDTTHLCLLLDTRAEEYASLAALAEDEQRFAIHTLPWILGDLQAQTVYCDAAYT